MQVTVNGLRLAYVERGREHQQSLLLIHGFPMDHHLWDAQLAGLSNVVGVVAPDLRGSGASEVPPGPYSMDQYADDLAALLDHLQIRRVVLGGLSMGGYATFAFWRRHPQRVRAMILVDSRAEPDSTEGKANREAAIARVSEIGAAAFAREQLPKLLAPASLRDARLAERGLALLSSANVPGMVATLQSLRDRPDSRPLLPTINVPTLVVVGAEDQVTPPSAAESMARAIPDSRLTIIPEAGHMSPLERPRAVNRAMREFLSNLAN